MLWRFRDDPSMKSANDLVRDLDVPRGHPTVERK